MRIASAAVAVFGAALLLISLAGDQLSLIIPLATLALAGILFLARGVSIYLTLLIALVSAVQICLTLIHVLWASGLVSPELVGEPSVAMPIAATVFVGVLLAISRIPVIRTIMSLTDPYFESRDVGTLQLWPFGRIRAQERWIGLGLVAVVIALQFALGAATIWTGKSADIATAHVAVGALSLATGAMATLAAFRGPVAGRIGEKKTRNLARQFVTQPDAIPNSR